MLRMLENSKWVIFKNHLFILYNETKQSSTEVKQQAPQNFQIKPQRDDSSFKKHAFFQALKVCLSIFRGMDNKYFAKE